MIVMVGVEPPTYFLLMLKSTVELSEPMDTTYQQWLGFEKKLLRIEHNSFTRFSFC